MLKKISFCCVCASVVGGSDISTLVMLVALELCELFLDLLKEEFALGC